MENEDAPSDRCAVEHEYRKIWGFRRSPDGKLVRSMGDCAYVRFDYDPPPDGSFPVAKLGEQREWTDSKEWRRLPQSYGIFPNNQPPRAQSPDWTIVVQGRRSASGPPTVAACTFSGCYSARVPAGGPSAGGGMKYTVERAHARAKRAGSRAAVKAATKAHLLCTRKQRDQVRARDRKALKRALAQPRVPALHSYPARLDRPVVLVCKLRNFIRAIRERSNGRALRPADRVIYQHVRRMEAAYDSTAEVKAVTPCSGSAAAKDEDASPATAVWVWVKTTDGTSRHVSLLPGAPISTLYTALGMPASPDVYTKFAGHYIASNRLPSALERGSELIICVRGRGGVCPSKRPLPEAANTEQREQTSSKQISSKRIETRPHPNTLTEQRSNFPNECGRQSSHILMIEFVDNSVHAMLQAARLKEGRPVHLPPIEVHLIYSEDFPHHLKHMAFFDAGPGMTEDTLHRWSRLCKPAIEGGQDGAAKPHEESTSEKDDAPPFQASAELSMFGKGSKAAGFFYGECVTAVTRRPGLEHKTHELRLDKKVMNDKEAVGHDWQQNEIKSRGQGRDAILSIGHWSEKDLPLLDLLERADEHPSYSLFIVSGIRSYAADELPRHSIWAVASELRDMYYVYCDGLESGLEGMRIRAAEGTAGAPSRTIVFPPARFKYSPLEVHVVAHSANQPVERISLRDDSQPPASTSLGADSAGVTQAISVLLQAAHEMKKKGEALPAAHSQLVEAQRWSPSKLLALAAPDPFFFKFEHPCWKTVWGITLYLPFVDGRETREEVTLHYNSRAMCFWAGRLMPYCKLPALLPWMDWANKEKDKSVADVKARVVMLLFFDRVAAVDHTKFRLNDDFLNELGKSEGLTGWAAWRERKQGWDWASSQQRQVEAEFKKWNEDCNAKYDVHCELSHRLLGTTDWNGKTYAMFGQLKYGSTAAPISYSQEDVAKVMSPAGASFTGSTRPRSMLGSIRHFLVEASTVTTGTRSHTCARCYAVVTREPASLYPNEVERVVMAQDLASKAPSVVDKMMADEHKKAPSQLIAAFVREVDAAAADASERTVNQELGRSVRTPLLVKANQPLPAVCVRPLNAMGMFVSDWQHGKDKHGKDKLKPLHVVQSVHFAPVTGAAAAMSAAPAADSATPSRRSSSAAVAALGAGIGVAEYGEPPPTADGTTYCDHVNKTVWKPAEGDDSTRGYHFNYSPLSFWKAGMYRLTYRLEQMPGGGERGLTTELFVLVTPALVKHLSCELAAPYDAVPVRLSKQLKVSEKGLVGGYGIEVRVRLRDGEGEFANTRLVSRGQLAKMADCNVVVFPNELLSHPRLNTEVAFLQSSDGQMAAKDARVGCRLFVGHTADKADHIERPRYLGEGHLTAGLWPSEAAVQQRLFSRHTPRMLKMEIILNDCPGVTDGAPRGSVDVPVVSAAPLCLRLAPTAVPSSASLPSAMDGPGWMYTSAAEALAAAGTLCNREPLPDRVAVVLRDEFECTLPQGVVVRLSAACVAPDAPDAPAAACAGVDGCSTALNPSGLAVFARLTPRLTSIRTVVEVQTPGGSTVRGALVRLRFTAAIGHDDSEAPLATPEDVATLATEGAELARLQVDRFLFLSASRKPSVLQLSHRGMPLLADCAGMLVLTGCAGSTLTDVHVTILNEVGDTLTWAEAEQAGILTLHGEEVDGSKPLSGLKLPSSVDDVARCRLTFVPRQEEHGSVRELALEAHLALKPEPGEPVQWLVRRSGVGSASTSRRREAAGPFELRVGDALADLFTIALVDAKGNTCRRARLAAGVAPVLSMRSGSDEVGPWLAVGAATRLRELVLNHAALDSDDGDDAVWHVRTGGTGHVSLVGPASTGNRPDEMLIVSDAHNAYEPETLSFKLLAGPPHSLELESKELLSSHDLRTRERLPPLAFLVLDAAGNPVPVQQLTIRSLAAVSPGLLKITHACEMKVEGISGARWSLCDVCLSADRARHIEAASSLASVASGRLSHELAFRPAPVAKAADGSVHILRCAPIQVVTCISGDFVVDVTCSSDNWEAAAAGDKLPPFKLSLRMEDGSVCEADEWLRRKEPGLGAEQAAAGHGVECIACVLNSPDGKLHLHRVEGTALFELPVPEAGATNLPLNGSVDCFGRLTRAGSYSVTATYTEQRPKVLEALRGTKEAKESKVMRTILQLNVSAGPPTRLRWVRAPTALVCNNTTELELFGPLEVRLEDAYGNPAVAEGALSGATLTAVILTPAEGFETLAASCASAEVPQLEGSVKGTIDGTGSNIVIGPVSVKRGSGRGNSQLCITFLVEGGAAGFPSIELPPDLAVTFVDTHSLEAEERRAKEEQAGAERQRRKRLEELEERRKAKADEVRRCNDQMLRHVAELREMCSGFVSKAQGVCDLYIALAKWTVDRIALVPGLQKNECAELNEHYRRQNPTQWDMARLAGSTAKLLQVDLPQVNWLYSILKQAFDPFIQCLGKPHWSKEVFPEAREYLIKLLGQAGHIRTFTSVGERLGEWVEHLKIQLGDQAASSDGLTDRERDVVNRFRKQSERNRQECFGSIADLLAVPFAGPNTPRITAVLSGIAAPWRLRTILLQSRDALERLRLYAREHKVQLDYLELVGTPAGRVSTPKVVQGVTTAWAAGDLVRPNPHVPEEVRATIDWAKLSLWLFRDTVVVRDEQEAAIYRRAVQGHGAPRIVGLLDGSLINSDGWCSDRHRGRLPTVLSRDPHFAIATSLCPLANLCFQAKDLAQSLETRSMRMQEKLEEWDQSSHISAGLNREMEQLLHQVNEARNEAPQTPTGRKRSREDRASSSARSSPSTRYHADPRLRNRPAS